MSKMSDTGIDDQQRALETREVTITLRLPPSIADQVEKLHTDQPEVLERVVHSALMRRAIYRLMRARVEESHTTEEV